MTPRLAAEVEHDRIPDLLGEIECVRAMLWGRLAIRNLRAALQPLSDR